MTLECSAERPNQTGFCAHAVPWNRVSHTRFSRNLPAVPRDFRDSASMAPDRGQTPGQAHRTTSGHERHDHAGDQRPRREAQEGVGTCPHRSRGRPTIAEEAVLCHMVQCPGWSDVDRLCRTSGGLPSSIVHGERTRVRSHLIQAVLEQQVWDDSPTTRWPELPGAVIQNEGGEEPGAVADTQQVTKTIKAGYQ